MKNEPSKNPWTKTRDELKNALDTWTQVSNQTEADGKLSPDDQMHQDMQKLLGQLKKKLEEFSK